jgi:glycerophosphoryl diester phosphodiesterase
VTSGPVQISAHDGHRGHGENGARQARGDALQAYRDALTARADYVEFDIRRTADGALVAFHDPQARPGQLVSQVGYVQLCDLAGYDVPKVADVLALIKGRAKGHLDLKETGGEDRLVRLALDILGPGEFIITSPDDASVAAIRSRFPAAEEVPVALTLRAGRLTPGPGRKGAPPTRLSALRARSRLRECGADWVAVDHRLALAGLVRPGRPRNLKVMVWTVNNEWEMRYWLSRPHIGILVTDRPALAVALRGRPADPASLCLLAARGHGVPRRRDRSGRGRKSLDDDLDHGVQRERGGVDHQMVMMRVGGIATVQAAHVGVPRPVRRVHVATGLLLGDALDHGALHDPAVPRPVEPHVESAALAEYYRRTAAQDYPRLGLRQVVDSFLAGTTQAIVQMAGRRRLRRPHGRRLDERGEQPVNRRHLRLFRRQSLDTPATSRDAPGAGRRPLQEGDA